MYSNNQKRDSSNMTRKNSFPSFSSFSSSILSTQSMSTNVPIKAINSASRLAATSTPAVKSNTKVSSFSVSKNTTSQVETSLVIKTKRKIIILANDLLKICREMDTSKFTREISSTKQINSELIVYFYEIILQEKLINKRQTIISTNDEIYNLQLVIDSLSNLMKEDLAHISAAEIIGKGNNRDFLSIEYLLDILKTFAVWLKERSESMVATISRCTNRSSRKCVESSNTTLMSYSLHTNSKIGMKDANMKTSYRQTREKSYDTNSSRFRSLSSISSWTVSSLPSLSARERESSELLKARRKMMEIVEKQTKQVDLMRKELEEARRLEQLKEERQMKIANKVYDREKKMEAIRRKRFEERLKLEMKGNDLKKNANAIKLTRSLSREIVQQERKNLNDLKKYYEDRFKEIMCYQNDRLESMSNFYQDRIKILRETMQNEKNDCEIRERANIEFVEKLRRECEAKLNMNLSKFKENIFKN